MLKSKAIVVRGRDKKTGKFFRKTLGQSELQAQVFTKDLDHDFLVACVVRMLSESTVWTVRTEVRIVNRRVDVLAETEHGYRVAYEIKTNMAGFRQELKDPAKRAPAVLSCQEFYFVLPEWQLPEFRDVPILCGLLACDRLGNIQMVKKCNA